MTASHAAKPAAWKRYKNRKQELRRAWKRGEVTLAKRELLQQIAWNRYQADKQRPAEGGRQGQ